MKPPTAETQLLWAMQWAVNYYQYAGANSNSPEGRKGCLHQSWYHLFLWAEAGGKGIGVRKPVIWSDWADGEGEPD